MLRPFLWYRAPAIVYAAALFWASGMSRLPLPHLGLDLQDKLLHASAYALFSLLIYRALSRPSPLVRRLHTGSALLGIGYAVTDELHQLFVPGRQAELSDLAADIIGIIAVQLVLYYRSRRQSG